MTPATLQVAGAFLVALAAAGFLTVADELRHSGEFIVVASLLVAGVALFVAGRFPRLHSQWALAWVPVGLGLGLLAGAAADRVAMGAVIGLTIGLVLARAMRNRPGAAG